MIPGVITRCFLRLTCSKKEVVKVVKEVYVLELEDNKVYVGESSNVRRRLWVHTNKNGSAWTKKHGVVRKLKSKIEPQSYFGELAETLEWMKEKGIDNVRGSMFTKPFNLSSSEKVMAGQLYCELHNLCRKCGGEGHFITRCPNGTVAEWVHQFGGVLEEKSSGKRLCQTCQTDIQELPYNYRFCRKCFSLEHYG